MIFVKVYIISFIAVFAATTLYVAVESAKDGQFGVALWATLLFAALVTIAAMIWLS